MSVSEFITQWKLESQREDQVEHDFDWPRYFIQVWRTICTNTEKYGDQIPKLEEMIRTEAKWRHGENAQVAFNPERREALIFNTDGFYREVRK